MVPSSANLLFPSPLFSSSLTVALVVGMNRLESPENPNFLLWYKVKKLVSLSFQSEDSKQQPPLST